MHLHWHSITAGKHHWVGVGRSSQHRVPSTGELARTMDAPMFEELTCLTRGRRTYAIGTCLNDGDAHP